MNRAALPMVAALFFTGTLISSANAGVCDLTFNNGVRLLGLPVAATTEEQARGLSDTDHIGNGLFFVWPNAEPRVFWMKNTRIPLTLGFLNADGILFGIEDMPVARNAYHLSMTPAKAALELPLGEFDRVGLKEGDRLNLRACRP